MQKNSKEKMSKNDYQLILKEKVESLLIDENLDYVLREVNDYLVHDAKEDADFCDCFNCLLDILALTLNKSQSRYRVLGRHAHKNHNDVRLICENIRVALHSAIERVKENPHHD